MSVNKYRDHLLVLPEDDANRQIANGFLLHPGLNERAIQILPPAGGWIKVRETFRYGHISEMMKYPRRMMLLLIDFDLHEDRINDVKEQIPADLADRLFVLGAHSEPEDLKKNMPEQNNTYEKIGKSLAQDCVDQTDHVWGHELLKHNKKEIDRMNRFVRPFLFD